MFCRFLDMAEASTWYWPTVKGQRATSRRRLPDNLQKLLKGVANSKLCDDDEARSLVESSFASALTQLKRNALKTIRRGRGRELR